VPTQLAPSVLLVAGGELSAYEETNFSRANFAEARSSMRVQRKFGLGPQAWVLQGSVGLGVRTAQLGIARGSSTEAGLQLAKRVLPNVRLAGWARWREYNARQAVFDVNQHSFGLDAQWDFGERWSLSGSASRLQGDVVANAAPGVWTNALGGGFGPTVRTYYTSRPWRETEIYGAGWVSYNVEADVDLWWLALAYSLSERTHLELRHDGAYVLNRIGIAYPSSGWHVTLSHHF